MATIGIQRVCLKNINTKITNSLIVGVIIAKQPCRAFPNKKNGSERGVWNFTLRDSQTDYINAICWGSAEYVDKLHQTYCIGDVVDVMNAKIEIRRCDDSGEQYRPAVTSPFSLTLNENQSSIVIHAGENYCEILSLLRSPTKPVAGCLKLADVHKNGETICGDLVDLLVVIRAVKEVRSVQMKKGGESQIRDIIVMDESSLGLTITLWEQDFIQRAEQWKPRETVLFLADIRIDWSQYQHSMVAALTSRTVVTEDPDIPDAENLRQFAKTAPLETVAILNKIASEIIDANSITTVMTCQNVLDKAFIEPDTDVNSIENLQFTALLYAFVTQLDLDGFTRITSTCCGRCNKSVKGSNGVCINLECPVASGTVQVPPKTSFDIKVMLSDHTGSLERCRLTGSIAEKVLGVTIEQFLAMTDDEKAELKWNFLLERCAVRIIVLKSYIENPPISIVSCSVADPLECAKNMCLY